MAVIITNPVFDVLNMVFEGLEAQDGDLPSLTCLFMALVKESLVDPLKLAKVLVNQNYIGTVLKPVVDEADMDEDDDPDDRPVYGATSIINLTKRKGLLTDEIMEFLDHHSPHFVEREVGGTTLFRNLISVAEPLPLPDKCLGILLKERMVNIPVASVKPALESLIVEMNEAVEKGMPYAIDYLVHWSKVYLDGNEYKHVNDEDDWFVTNCIGYFTYVLHESDNLLVSRDNETISAPQARRVYLIKWHKLSEFIDFIGAHSDAHSAEAPAEPVEPAEPEAGDE